jgi:Fe-S cluster assembly protein SufD
MSASPAVPAASAALRSFEAALRARPADPLAAMRTEAMGRFLALGLPTPRDESWRYTNLRALAGRSFVDAPPVAARADAAGSWLAAAGTTVIRLVNGYPDVGADGLVGAGFEAISLRAAAARDPGLLAKRIAPAADGEEERWALLNRAMFVDGLLLRVKSTVAAPILIEHATDVGRDDSAVHARLIVEVAPGAGATIIEHHLACGTTSALANHASQIEIAAGGSLEHYRVISSGERANQIDTLDLRQARDSRCRQFTIVLGGGLVRTHLRADLAEPGAALDSAALLVGRGARHVDCINTVRHGASATTSRQNARAIGAGTSRVIFNSKVTVAGGTKGADSRQSLRALLLSATAEVDTRPQLEIHADDVKCAHGATTGRLDPDMLFYLLSRGIDRAAAQSLLIYAFLDDILTTMSSPGARKAVEDALIDQLPDAELLRAFR